MENIRFDDDACFESVCDVGGTRRRHHVGLREQKRNPGIAALAGGSQELTAGCGSHYYYANIVNSDVQFSQF